MGGGGGGGKGGGASAPKTTVAPTPPPVQSPDPNAKETTVRPTENLAQRQLVAKKKSAYFEGDKLGSSSESAYAKTLGG